VNVPLLHMSPVVPPAHSIHERTSYITPYKVCKSLDINYQEEIWLLTTRSLAQRILVILNFIGRW